MALLVTIPQCPFCGFDEAQPVSSAPHPKGFKQDDQFECVACQTVFRGADAEGLWFDVVEEDENVGQSTG